VGNQTYNGVVHGAQIGPRSVIRGELMDSLVPTVAEVTMRECAFAASFQLPSSPLDGHAAWRALRKA